MATLALILLVVAVALAVLRGCGVTAGRADLGWLAIACVIAAVWMLPAVTQA